MYHISEMNACVQRRQNISFELFVQYFAKQLLEVQLI